MSYDPTIENDSTESSDNEDQFFKSKRPRRETNFNSQAIESTLNKNCNSSTDKGKNNSANTVFKKVKHDISDEEILRWLEDAEQGSYDNYVMDSAPVKPKGGEVFLYRCNSLHDQDYRRDQYTGFQLNGHNAKFDSTFYKEYFVLKEGTKVMKGFKKDATWLRTSSDKPHKIVMIHYKGDERIWHPRAHGNANDKAKTFTSTTKKVMRNIRETLKVTGKPPLPVYMTTLKKSALDSQFEKRQGSTAPRNWKQVANQSHLMKKENRIHEDELMAVYLMARTKMLGDFIREMKVIGSDAVVVAETAMLNLAKALLDESAKDQEFPIAFGYDSTYDLVDAFVSPLIMRNAFVVGNKIFPVAFLIHEKRDTDSHKCFWLTMKNLLPLHELPPTVPIVTDREGGLVKGLRLGLSREEFEGNNSTEQSKRIGHSFCSIHIKRDVKQWILGSKGHTSSDVKVLLDHVDELLNAETEEQFQEFYNTFEEVWSQDFKIYMDIHIKSDMQLAARFYTKKFPVFQDLSSTTNFVESWNAVLKRANDWKRLRYDSLILNLFNSTLFYTAEFHRAYNPSGCGNYQVLLKYLNGGPPFELPHYAYWSEQKFLALFKEEYKSEPKIPDETQVSSARALARLACEMGYVSLNSQTSTYCVTGPYDGSKAFVEEDDAGKLVCSCDEKAMCFHKEAYLRVTKKRFESGKITWKLSTLRRKTRNFKGPSGKKKVQRSEIKDVVPAPDSDRAQKYVHNIDDDKLEEVCIQEDTRCENGKLPTRANQSSNTLEKIVPNSIRESAVTSLCVADDDDYNDDEAGLHHYSAAESRHDDCASISSIYTCANGETPKEFSLAHIPTQISHSLYRGALRYLLPDQLLSTDVVDDFCCLMISVHNLEDKIAFASTMDFYNAEDATYDSLRKLTSWAMRSESLNSDGVLVPIHYRGAQHFLLAMIIWKTKQVILLNSLPGCPTNLETIVRGLMRIIACSHLVAQVPYDLADWSFVEEENVPLQENTVSCGVFVALNALSICSRNPVTSTEEAPTESQLRKWMLMCLTNNGVNRPVRLRIGQVIHRLSPQDRDSFANEIIAISFPSATVMKTQSWVQMRTATRTRMFASGKCDALECQLVGTYTPAASDVLCVTCRNWFHSGVCVPSKGKDKVFYVCPSCRPT